MSLSMLRSMILSRKHIVLWRKLVCLSSMCSIVLTVNNRPITRMPGGPVDVVLETIGKRIGATSAQVIFAWVRSKGAVIVTYVFGTNFALLDNPNIYLFKGQRRKRADCMNTSKSPICVRPTIGLQYRHVNSNISSIADLTPEEITAIEEAGEKGPPSAVVSSIILSRRGASESYRQWLIQSGSGTIRSAVTSVLLVFTVLVTFILMGALVGSIDVGAWCLH